MSSETPIIFYDIASAPPLRTFAPNPWKTRLALNFKGLPYRTQWVQMPDIAAVREDLGVPANRTNADGTPYHTLPVIQDKATGKLLGDSFEIVQYLDSVYPDTPKLIRPFTMGLVAAFNAHVDGIFTKHVVLSDQMPFDPDHQEKIYAMFAQRMAAAPSQLLADFPTTPEQREAKFVSFELALGELAKAFRHTGGTTDYFLREGGTQEGQRQRPPPERKETAVWLDGDEPAYADFIVGGWLKSMEASMKAEDWQRVRSWQGGLWGRLVDALEKWSEIK